jgi:putative endonuclease
VTAKPRDCNDSAADLKPSADTAQSLRGFGADAVSAGTARRLAWPAMSADLRQHLGRNGEDLALAHLQRLGYELVVRNHRTRWGEIDLVVHDGDVLVFVEVKTRRATGSGRGPWEALHERKRMQVRRMAAAFLAEVRDRPRSSELRFDAIGVVIDAHGRLVRLDHLEAAF